LIYSTAPLPALRCGPIVPLFLRVNERSRWLGDYKTHSLTCGRSARLGGNVTVPELTVI
jgi:hypothetical protein